MQAQIYTDYVGAGHTQGVTVRSSSNSTQADASSSINGSGFEIDAYGAACFLNYASLGADFETINTVADQGISEWLDGQINVG